MPLTDDTATSPTIDGAVERVLDALDGRPLYTLSQRAARGVLEEAKAATQPRRTACRS